MTFQYPPRQPGRAAGHGKNASLVPAGFSDSDLAARERLRACITKVVRSAVKQSPASTVEHLAAAITDEFGHLTAAQSAFANIERSVRGQRPAYHLQVFLGKLEQHFASVGIDLPKLLKPGLKGEERFTLIQKLLRCAGIRHPQTLKRQWQQRLRS